MRKLFALLTMVLTLGISGFIMAGACEDVTDIAEGVCGECGKVSQGDATISGNAELDGIFKAVGTLKMSTGAIKGSFDADVRAMAEGVFEIDVEGKTTADLVAEIKAEFETWITANVEGGLNIKYQGPKCQASLDVAVSAQAQCEAKVDASCSADVECTPGSASFECSGSCEGSCEGTCEVPSCSVKVEPGSANCEGSCEGSCTVELSAAASCEGKCEGTCDGECSAHDASGNCTGSCSGECRGSCTVSGEAAAECSGSCSGSCKLTGPSAEAACEGNLGCSGKCEGSCSGGCTGEITAPKCEGKVECNAEASAKCEAQASAQASASLECTPPSLEIDIAFKAGVNAGAKADFLAKLDKFKVSMIAILQGTAKLRALVDADAAAELGITPPAVTIKASVDTFLKAVQNNEIEFKAPGLALCALPAFEESASILGSLAGEMKTTIDLQLEMAGMLKL